VGGIPMWGLLAGGTDLRKKIREVYLFDALFGQESSFLHFLMRVREGDVGTWPTQPLVLVNYGNATSKELLDFSDKMISIIEEKVGIRLEREVNYVS
jgi:hypothetical protein